MANPAFRLGHVPPAQDIPLDYEVTGFGSGTQALAATLLMLAGNGSPRNAVLPAYGCPDLVSACEHARVTPVLADVDPATGRLDIDAAVRACDDGTCAVVAVNLLGLGDDYQRLRQRLPQQVAVVQDSAQSFERQSWQADHVVLSFGRGKPVNGLGGGAMLSRQAPVTEGLAEEPAFGPGYAVKAALFELAVHPHLFGWLRRLPGLHVGETRYRKLQRIVRRPQIDRRFREILAHFERELAGLRERQSRLLASLVDHGELRPMVSDPQRPLLRVPLLASDGDARERWLARLGHLGASAMYVETLPQIMRRADDYTDTPLQGEFPGAVAFAQRLLTLPNHRWVDDVYLEALTRALRA